jgi:hypothetical protein
MAGGDKTVATTGTMPAYLPSQKNQLCGLSPPSPGLRTSALDVGPGQARDNSQGKPLADVETVSPFAVFHRVNL